MLLNCGVREDSWEVPWTARRSNQSTLKKSVLNVHWRTDAKAETPILWPPDRKNWLFGKVSDAGKDWRQVEKGMTEEEMVGWHHQLDGQEFEQAPGVGDGHGSLACCIPWVTESDKTERLNWTDLYTSTQWTMHAKMPVLSVENKPFYYLFLICHFGFSLNKFPRIPYFSCRQTHTLSTAHFI